MTRAAVPAPARITAAWLSDRNAQAVFEAVVRGGFTARAVGGAVRNALLGRPVSDVDIATDAPPPEVIRLVEAAGLKSVPTGLDHGTVTVISGARGYEVTTLRRDIATDGRHAEVAFTSDWAADAARRDLTINALYCDADGTLFDPLGGMADLDPVRVRFIGDPVARIREDYLRILRFYRFTAAYAAKGALDREGRDACRREAAGLARISGERIQAELFKLLVADHAAAVVTALAADGVFQALFGLLGEWAGFQRLIEREQRCGIAASSIRRLAALGVFEPDDAAKIDARLKLSSQDRARLGALASRWDEIRPSLGEARLKAQLYRWGRESYEDAALLCWARDMSKGQHPSNAEWLAVATLPQRFEPPRFPLSGRDLLALGYTEGPALGEALKRLEEAWIAAAFAPDRDALRDLARRSRADG